MPTVEQNYEMWAGGYDWSGAGDEWSEWWGSTEAQWRWTVHPRIASFLPARTILEIAPGFGRWTNYLRRYADRLILVDLSDKCIDACRQRFAAESHLEYHVNDGTSLAMVPDGSIDFVFSFDSLVHAEAEVLRAYLKQLATKLSADGVGFVHHSNWGSYRRYFTTTDRLPHPVKFHLTKHGFLEKEGHWRGRTMTARLFEQFAREAGLVCIGQELLNWGVSRLTDSISVFTLPGSRWARPNLVVENPKFMEEAAQAKRLGELYAATRAGQAKRA
jgi:SAM-dependent methyltransferase